MSYIVCWKLQMYMLLILLTCERQLWKEFLQC